MARPNIVKSMSRSRFDRWKELSEESPIIGIAVETLQDFPDGSARCGSRWASGGGHHAAFSVIDLVELRASVLWSR